MTGDHIRQRLADKLIDHGLTDAWAKRLAAALEQTVRDLIADELDAAADDDPCCAWGSVARRHLRDRAAAVRARTEETTP